jgi:antitoxin FitA
MRNLTIALPEETAARVDEAARSHGVSVEELVRRSLEEKLARDAEFEAAADRVLSRNAELYERLS